jgi:hypothetical protein
MLMCVSSIRVQHVKVVDVRPAVNHRNVEHVMALEWKRSKRDRSLCVQHVVRVMADVKQYRSRATNVQAKAKQHRRNTPAYQYQPVSIVYLRF